MTSLPRYAIAYGVLGFGGGARGVSIRVNVYRLDGDYVFCRTACLQDAGTRLVLDRSQIEWEDAWQDDAVSHKDGLVVLG